MGAFEAFATFIRGSSVGTDTSQMTAEHGAGLTAAGQSWPSPPVTSGGMLSVAPDGSGGAASRRPTFSGYSQADVVGDAVDATADLASGRWVVAFGTKYRGWTFEEVLTQDPRYCAWLVSQVMHSTRDSPQQCSRDMLAFVAYVQ